MVSFLPFQAAGGETALPHPPPPGGEQMLGPGSKRKVCNVNSFFLSCKFGSFVNVYPAQDGANLNSVICRGGSLPLGWAVSSGFQRPGRGCPLGWHPCSEQGGRGPPRLTSQQTRYVRPVFTPHRFWVGRHLTPRSYDTIIKNPE